MNKATNIRTFLLTLLLVMPSQSASSMKIENLPNYLLFLDKETVSSKKIFLLLTYIETQAYCSKSAEDFLQYLKAYDWLIQKWRPYFFNVTSPLDTNELSYCSTRHKLKSIVKAISYNPSLRGNDLYLLYLRVVVMKIIDGFGLNYQAFNGCYDSITQACSYHEFFGTLAQNKSESPQKKPSQS